MQQDPTDPGAPDAVMQGLLEEYRSNRIGLDKVQEVIDGLRHDGDTARAAALARAVGLG